MRRTEPAEQIVALPPLALRAEVAVGSINVDARTVDVIFSTGAEVERVDFWSGTRYLESLAVAPGAVRLDRLNAGAPLLDAHSAWSVADQLGTVERGTARLVDGRAVATVRFSKRPTADAVFADVRDGIVSNVSVGYRVHKYERTPADDETRTPEKRRAVDWEPYEISAVPMGADAGAKFRSAADRARVPTEPCVIVTAGGVQGERSMSQTSTNPRPAVVEPRADGTAPDGYELRADGRCYLVETPDERSERERGILAERERVEGIIAGALAARRRRDDPEILRFIREGTPLVEVQRWLLDSLREAAVDTAGPRVGPSAAVTRDPLDGVFAGIRGALLNRVDPAHFPLDDAARPYRAFSIIRVAEECLEQRGIRTRHLSPSDVIKSALGLDTRAGLHTTSDFANLLGDVAGRVLRAAYAEAPQTWQPLASRINIPDFRPIRPIDFGDAPALKKVLEHGEFTRGTISTSREEMTLATYGRVFGLTRQAMVNDDLDAFGRIPALFAKSARTLESDVVWGEILVNGVMADGENVFDSAHANLASPGTVISVASLGTARAAIGIQRNFDNVSYLSLRARYLVVPPALETIADQYTTAVTPQVPGSVNPFAGRLAVISEPRLEGGVTLPDGTVVAGSALAWYMFASPDQVPIVEYGYLSGEEGPALDQRVGFDIDGLEIKCRLDFVAKIMNYRGAYKNPGAAA